MTRDLQVDIQEQAYEDVDELSAMQLSDLEAELADYRWSRKPTTESKRCC